MGRRRNSLGIFFSLFLAAFLSSKSHAQLTGTASTLSTTLTTTSGPGPEDTCYARGECDPTLVLEEIEGSPTPDDCARECNAINNNRQCIHFTHVASEQLCRAFYECDFFSYPNDTSTTCADCVTGPRDCAGEQLCFLPGFCSGAAPLDIVDTDTAEECLEECQDTSSCEWMSYFASTGDCYLLASCNDVDFIREGDVYAQRDCPLEPDDGGNDRNEQYFILVGGRVDLGESTARSYVYTVAEGGNKELEEQPEACRPDGSDFAFEIDSHVMMNVVDTDDQTKPMVCGGYDPHARAPTANCSYLSSRGGPPPPYEWVDDLLLAAPRENAFAVELENGMYFIFGGIQPTSGSGGGIGPTTTLPPNYGLTTEVFNGEQINDSAAFEEGPDLEQWLDRSCGAYLGNDRVLVVGGFVVDEGTDTNRAYTVDLNTFSVTQENSMGLPRHAHACGAVTVDDGSVEVVVAGGVNAEASTEIFRGGIWLPGEQLFTPRRYATSLPLSGSVLMIGGRTEDGEYLDGAWFWNYVTEHWDNNYVFLDQDNSQAAAVLVPDFDYFCAP